MSARERECGELPSPELSPFHRKVGRGLFVSANCACRNRHGFYRKFHFSYSFLPPMNSPLVAEWILHQETGV